jgi:hypothetical protein
MRHSQHYRAAGLQTDENSSATGGCGKPHGPGMGDNCSGDHAKTTMTVAMNGQTTCTPPTLPGAK